MKIELTIDDLKALMYEASKTYNLTKYERTEVSQSEGIKLYIDRIIKNFQDDKSKK